MFRKTLSTLAVAALGLGVAAPAALAGTDEAITTDRGTVSFTDRDEIVTANDKKKDGFSIMAFLSWKDPKTGKGRSVSVTDGNGANNSPNAKNLSLPEGLRVNLKMCYVDNEIVKKCSKPQAATA